MARKNRRDDGFVPLDLTPNELESYNEGSRTPEYRAKRAERNLEDDADRARRQAKARVDQGIDWSTCVVPGCGRSLILFHGRSHRRVDRRDSSLEIPICYAHAGVIWNQLVQFHANSAEFAEAVADVNERTSARDARQHEERKASNLANVNYGDIYFVRVGGLVKVGWTRDLWQRLKSYGASAELLVSYPASRDDETHLHRQLTPARAKGREWYEDGAIIAKFIDEALAKYGTPRTYDDMWTKPKQVVAGKRVMRYR